MTDDHLLPDDELVSAFIDDEASDEERARVQGDPGLLARAEAFRQVKTLIGPSPVAPPGAADTVVASALDALTTDDDARDAQVTPLAPRRNRRRALFAAAAAAAVVVVAVPVVGRLAGRSGTVEMASTSPQAKDESAVATEPLAEANASGGQAVAGASPEADSSTGAGAANRSAAPTTVAAGAGTESEGAFSDTTQSYAGHLGDLSSPDDVSDAVRDVAEPTTSTTSAPTTTAPTSTTSPAMAAVGPPCADAARAADPSLGTLVLSATATYQGTPVWVLVFAVDDGTGAETGRQVVVLEQATCAVVLSRSI